MIVLKRGQITYYIKEEAVVVSIQDFQHIAYTVYPLQNRKPFYDFRRALLRSAEDEYNSPAKLIKLAQHHSLKGVASHKPSERLVDEDN
jgi:hypothetical protein